MCSHRLDARAVLEAGIRPGAVTGVGRVFSRGLDSPVSVDRFALSSSCYLYLLLYRLAAPLRGTLAKCAATAYILYTHGRRLGGS